MKSLGWFTYIFVLLFVLSACGGNGDVSRQANDPSIQGNEGENLVRVKNSNPLQERDMNDSWQEKADHLVSIASDVPKVRDATAVVVGDLAVVGIDIDGEVDRSEVGTIKYSVTEALQDDPHGADSVVVADPDMYARLQEVADDMQNGRPFEGVFNELSDIVGRVMPEIPGQLQNPTPKDAVEDSKDGANQQEKETLEKEQQEQSNGKKNDGKTNQSAGS
ncbi:YhcN/YlaJ family sporulation lipoprotein [Bacillus fonticola]|uniref:YhcN/YlaJ family sporulation lipoprotein n=1 Tax=Bacillus fonticola TaxID=2728853 RepID=UPI001475458E|nr:YhcN/YlaJ family sporulation lipoprotein [Bacillus fonticola]